MPHTLSRRGVLAGSLGLAATARAEIGSHGYELTQPEIDVYGLDPAHDGLRIAQLSDIHVGMNTPEARVRAAVTEVNALKPDVVFLTGDFVTYCKRPLPLVSSLLAGIEAPTYAVLGNHDHFVDARSVEKALGQASYALLRNQHTVVSLRGAPVTLLGVDDGGTGHDDVAATFAGAAKKGTRLVLTHNPLTARKLPPAEGLLCFSGHTHGGQVVIPPISDPIAKALGAPYIRGRYDVQGNQLYVNRGLGWGRRSQFLHHGSEPEVTLFTLRYRERA